MIERMTGVAIVAFGAVLLFFITPYATETVGYGWLRPKTVPDVMAVILILSGAVLALAPPQGQFIDFAKMARAAGFLVVVGVGLWAWCNGATCMWHLLWLWC